MRNFTEEPDLQLVDQAHNQDIGKVTVRIDERTVILVNSEDNIQKAKEKYLSHHKPLIPEHMKTIDDELLIPVQRALREIKEKTTTDSEDKYVRLSIGTIFKVHKASFFSLAGKILQDIGWVKSVNSKSAMEYKWTGPENDPDAELFINACRKKMSVHKKAGYVPVDKREIKIGKVVSTIPTEKTITGNSKSDLVTALKKEVYPQTMQDEIIQSKINNEVKPEPKHGRSIYKPGAESVSTEVPGPNPYIIIKDIHIEVLIQELKRRGYKGELVSKIEL